MTVVLEDQKEVGLNPLKLTPVGKALEILGRRRATRRIIGVDDPINLNIHWDREAKNGKGGFVIEPPKAAVKKIEVDGPVKDYLLNHGKMELADSAVDSMLHHADLSMPRAILPSMLPAAFTASIRTKMGSMKGLNFITDGTEDNSTRRVEAFVPGRMNSISDQELVDNVLGRIVDKYGDAIQGVRINSFAGETTKRYSIVFGALGKDDEGNKIVRPLFNDSKVAMDPMKTTWPAIDVFADDLGLGQTTLSLGLFRVICVNMALSTFWQAGRASWNRLGEPEGFMNRANKIIDVAGRFAMHTAKALQAAQSEQIPNAEEIVQRLQQHEVISTAHAESAEDYIARDDPQSGFDLFQVLTDSAKNLSTNAMKDAQSTAVAILMGGGFKHVALHGLDMKVAEKEMDACLA